MSRIIFNYAVMNSSKSLLAITTGYTYKKHKVETLILKPSIDVREDDIHSRAGLAISTDFTFTKDYCLEQLYYEGLKVIIIDEVQFCTPVQIKELWNLAHHNNVEVITYGLLTDFQSLLFPASKRLIEIADECQQVTSTLCHKCKEKEAQLNMRTCNGVPTLTGDTISIGDAEYLPVCTDCYFKMTEEINHD